MAMEIDRNCCSYKPTTAALNEIDRPSGYAKTTGRKFQTDKR